jgi:hypothetical protein
MDIPIEERVFSKITDNSGSTILSLVGFFERLMFLCIAVIMNIFLLD